MYAFRSSSIRLFPRQSKLRATSNVPISLTTPSPSPSIPVSVTVKADWQTSRKSKSGNSGYAPASPQKSTRRHADTVEPQPTTLSQYTLHKTLHAHTPNSQTPKHQRIPLFQPATPYIFIRSLKNSPATAMSILETSLEKISGADKISLLRSMQFERFGNESARVYQALVKNSLVSRLTYADHHRQLHLLKRDPILHRAAIEECWCQIRLAGMIPAQNLVSLMLSCALEWRDGESAWGLLKQMSLDGTAFETEGFNDFLGCVGVSAETMAVWHAEIGKLTPTLRTIRRGFELFSGIGDLAGVEAVMKVEQEHRVFIERDYENVIQKGRGINATSYTLALNNALMSAWIGCREHSRASVIFNSMLSSEQRMNGDTFNLAVQLTVHAGDFQKIDTLFALFEKQDVKADSVVYGRVIEACGGSGRGDLGLLWFDRGVEALRVELGGRKWVGLSTSLVHSYVLCKEYRKATEVYKGMNGKGFRSTSRYGIAAYCGLGDVSAALDVLERNREYFVQDYDEMCHHVIDNAQAAAERLLMSQ